MRQFRFSPALPATPAFTIGDGVILLGMTTIIYAGVRLAFRAPLVIAGPDISLSPLALPWYVLLSVGRMAAAYFLSLLFSLFYGISRITLGVQLRQRRPVQPSSALKTAA